MDEIIPKSKYASLKYKFEKDGYTAEFYYFNKVGMYVYDPSQKMRLKSKFYVASTSNLYCIYLKDGVFETRFTFQIAQRPFEFNNDVIIPLSNNGFAVIGANGSTKVDIDMPNNFSPSKYVGAEIADEAFVLKYEARQNITDTELIQRCVKTMAVADNKPYKKSNAKKLEVVRQVHYLFLSDYTMDGTEMLLKYNEKYYPLEEI